MDEKSDTAGIPIYPSELPRVLGLGFVSLSQIKNRAGLTPEQATKARDFLVARGLFQAWYAAKCPHCGYAWPLRTVDHEEEIPDAVVCPVCNHTTPSEVLPIYEVFKVIK